VIIPLKNLTLLLLWLSLSFAVPANAFEVHSDTTNNSLANESERCQLKYAWAPVPPFIVSNSPEPSGYQIDMIRWIAAELNCELKFIELDWANSLRGIEAGTIDIIGRSSLTIQRQQWAHFSIPYSSEVLVLNIRKGEKEKYRGLGLEALLQQGFKLGVLKEAYYGASIERLQRTFIANLFEYAFAIDLLIALERNEIDGFFEAPFILDSEIMSDTGQRNLEEYPIEIVTGELHFMFSKKSVAPEFVESFNQTLQVVKASEVFQKHEYWSRKR
jgi:polar amino acid transport system substrate-binding protein